MKIVFSVEFVFGDFECGQMACYHFFYQTYRTRRYGTKKNNAVTESDEYNDQQCHTRDSAETHLFTLSPLKETLTRL